MESNSSARALALVAQAAFRGIDRMTDLGLVDADDQDVTVPVSAHATPAWPASLRHSPATA